MQIYCKGGLFLTNEFKIGNLVFSKPIVQGGMGIGISLSKLAGAVSKNGGLGVLSGVEMGHADPDYRKNPKEANCRALKAHFKEAKRISGNRPIGINIMVALNQYEEIVKNAINTGVDIIFVGAGLPLNLPALTKDSDIKIAPIVSSKRVSQLILKHWWRHFKKIPDALVLEGPLAGGHLGFKKDDLKAENIEKFALIPLIKDVLEALKAYEDLSGHAIPLIAGGGIISANDVKEVLSAGASAVQLGSRFVATDECDASTAFKEALIKAQAEDIKIIESPAGLPGRAIDSPFLKEVAQGKRRPKSCPMKCLKSCDFKTTPYCIASALIAGKYSDFNNGFVFSGAKAYQINELISVEALMDELVSKLD